MKKLFKNLAVVLLTVCAVFACAFAVSACNNEPTYTFIIQYEDGTPVNGKTAGLDGGKVMTQICTDTLCQPLIDTYTGRDIYPDENGKLELTQKKINEIFGSETDVTEFAFHVMDVPGYNSDCAFEVSGAKEYVCKLSKAK